MQICISVIVSDTTTRDEAEKAIRFASMLAASSLLFDGILEVDEERELNPNSTGIQCSVFRTS